MQVRCFFVRLCKDSRYAMKTPLSLSITRFERLQICVKYLLIYMIYIMFTKYILISFGTNELRPIILCVTRDNIDVDLNLNRCSHYIEICLQTFSGDHLTGLYVKQTLILNRSNSKVTEYNFYLINNCLTKTMKSFGA